MHASGPYSVTVAGVLQYSNMYMVTPAIRELAENRDMQQECVQYVTIPGQSQSNDHHAQCSPVLPGRNPPPITEIFKLYSQLRQGTRFGEFCGRNNTDSLGVDDWFVTILQICNQQLTCYLCCKCCSRLIAFGIVNKLLRRIHHYPVNIGSSEIGVSRSLLSKQQVAELLKYFFVNVAQCLDCCVAATCSLELILMTRYAVNSGTTFLTYGSAMQMHMF